MLMGISIFGDVLLRKQMLAMAAKTGLTAATLTTRMAKDMAALAKTLAPVWNTGGGRLRSTIGVTATGLKARVRVGKGIRYPLYAEFSITKGGEIREPSGRFWYPSLGEIKRRLRAGGMLDKSFNEFGVHY